jgi:hypothetical protein
MSPEERAAARQRLSREMCDQVGNATHAIADTMAQIMTMQGIDLIDGVSIGIRAGKMAEAMARANTARRVRDIDGYRRALREAAAYIVGALVEIGEPIVLPPGTDEWTWRPSRPRFSETEAYRVLIADRKAAREADANQAMSRHTLAAGTGDEIVMDDGSGRQIIEALQARGWKPSTVVSIEDGDEVPD